MERNGKRGSRKDAQSEQVNGGNERMKNLTDEKPQQEESRKMKKSALFLVALMASYAMGTSTVQAQAYIVRDLGVAENMTASEPTALNSGGYVTGTSYNDTASCAFQYSKKSMLDVGGFNSRGFAINFAGQIAGDAYFTRNIALVSHAVV